jgi:predicted Zn finger-like uncharacterized protein
MFTRCPQCQTVHSIGAEQLSQARGLVQCGPCGRSFSALSFLYDAWPEGEPHRPADGSGVTLPVLEPAVNEAIQDVNPAAEDIAALVADTVAADLPAEEEAKAGTETAATGLQAGEPEAGVKDSGGNRLAWGLATAGQRPGSKNRLAAG